MKYKVMFSCGHEDVRELFGSESSKQERINYYNTKGLCTRCYKSKILADKEQEYNIIEMMYDDYKNNYSNYKTVSGSYDAKLKKVKVYIPKQ